MGPEEIKGDKKNKKVQYLTSIKQPPMFIQSLPTKRNGGEFHKKGWIKQVLQWRKFKHIFFLY